MKHLFLILVLALLPTLMEAQQKHNFPLEKLAGKWKMLTRKGLQIEEWEQVDSTTLTGKNYLSKSGDTILLKHLVIKMKGDTLVYTLITGKQNEAIFFVLTDSDDDHYTFENSRNRSSQRIHYKFTGTDSLHIWIEEGEAMAAKSSEYHYTRIKN